MFPLYDSTPRRNFPFVNYLIIALNIYFFWLELTSVDPEAFITTYSFIPQQFALFNPASYLPILYSLFIHGGLLHILSNMWFLHIFGDNVEDRMGHFQYLIFYLLGGVAATLGQYFIAPHSTIPMIGASGAISAVAGAYFVFYRHSKVKALVPFILIFTLIDIPVWLFLGYWFFIQIFSGLGSLTAMSVQDGGVAWFAHVGGFIFGYLVAKFFYRENYAAVSS
ncbi:MAG: rhomboid family intramembrane serine protease [Patescibacteria group bacterium]